MIKTWGFRKKMYIGGSLRLRTIFLVEDEVIVREGIKKIVPWEEQGFSFVGEASDGELALPMIQKLKPDVLITDIKMPFMDGLTLSRIVKEELPHTKIIILSGYDDFQYAREAIEIGISDYLLKPISKDSIVRTLKEVNKKMEEEDKQQEQYEQLVQESEKFEEYEKKDFFEKAISGTYNAKELLDMAHTLSIDVSAQSYAILLLFALRIKDPNKEHLLTKLKMSIKQVVDDKQVIIIQRTSDSLAFVVKSDANLMDQQMTQIIDQIQRICNAEEKLEKWKYAIGTTVNRLSAWKESYDSAMQALVGVTEKQEKDKMHFQNLDFHKLNEINVEEFLKNGLPTEVDDFVEAYFHSYGPSPLDSLLLRQYVVMNVRLTTYAFLNTLGKVEQIREKEETRFLNSIHNVETAKQYVKQIITEVIEIRSKISNQRYSNTMDKVIDYINQNYAKDDLSLNEVARIANITPSHFSTVFSKERGVTFVEYLTNLRMKKAKELLRCTSLPSMEIAYRVGYKDPHYFSAQFKKTQGYTPRDYRSGKDIV